MTTDTPPMNAIQQLLKERDEVKGKPVIRRSGIVISIPECVEVEIIPDSGQWLDVSKWLRITSAGIYPRDAFNVWSIDTAPDAEQQAIKALLQGEPLKIRYGFWGKFQNHPYTVFRCVSVSPSKGNTYCFEGEPLEEGRFDETAGVLTYMGDHPCVQAWRPKYHPTIGDSEA